VIKNQDFSEASDWWSFGCLLHEFLTGESAFSGLGPFQIKQSILNCEPQFNKAIDSNAKDLIQKLLCKNKSNRLQNPAFIKQHPFFEGIDFDAMMTPTEDMAPNKP
jgi:serine/threonine protein kinase